MQVRAFSPNRYAGPCQVCNEWVPAGGGETLRIIDRVGAKPRWVVRCDDCRVQTTASCADCGAACILRPDVDVQLCKTCLMAQHAREDAAKAIDPSTRRFAAVVAGLESETKRKGKR